MDRLEQEKLKEQEWQNKLALTPGAFMEVNKTAEPHPREALLSDLNNQEQLLLDRLHALRDLRNEYHALSRDEAKRLLTITKLCRRAF